MHYEPKIKCATFDAEMQAAIPADIRAKMDADRAAAEAAKPKRDKVWWLAVKSYWDAYSRNGSWPHTSVARRPQYDRFPHRESKAYSPEYVRDLC